MRRLEINYARVPTRFADVTRIDHPTLNAVETPDRDSRRGALYSSPQKNASSITGRIINFKPIICHGIEYAPSGLARKPEISLPYSN